MSSTDRHVHHARDLNVRSLETQCRSCETDLTASDAAIDVVGASVRSSIVFGQVVLVVVVIVVGLTGNEVFVRISKHVDVRRR